MYPMTSYYFPIFSYIFIYFPMISFARLAFQWPGQGPGPGTLRCLRSSGDLRTLLSLRTVTATLLCSPSRGFSRKILEMSRNFLENPRHF